MVQLPLTRSLRADEIKLRSEFSYRLHAGYGHVAVTFCR